MEDVAQAVLFFAAGPGFITGQILVVDGGLGKGGIHITI
jgi:3-oxoacyl-[acyl-carrier protein] reductase/pteridine reductase